MWVVGTDAQEIHALLCESDKMAARTSNTSVPMRNMASSERYVASGNVHVLKDRGTAIAMFTLTTTPTFNPEGIDFPGAKSPVYLTRLAIHPEVQKDNKMLGFKTVKKMIEEAKRRGHDVIWNEVNPDIADVMKLLVLSGFKELVTEPLKAGTKVKYMYRELV